MCKHGNLICNKYIIYILQKIWGSQVRGHTLWSKVLVRRGSRDRSSDGFHEGDLDVSGSTVDGDLGMVQFLGPLPCCYHERS